MDSLMHVPGNNYFNAVDSLPIQTLTSSKKTKKWKERNMDRLEKIAEIQFNENFKFQQNYDMIDGKIDPNVMYDLPEEMLELIGIDSYEDLSSDLKHYDIIGMMVRALESEYLENGFIYSVRQLGEFFDNEFKRHRTELYHQQLFRKLEIIRQRKLAELGINPETDMEFMQPEEKDAYLQELNQIISEVTPEGIEEYMTYDFETVELKWAQATLEHDYVRFRLDDLNRENLRDFLCTGRCFRHFPLKYNNYKPEVWRARQTFFSKDLESRYAQYGEYIGYISWESSNSLIQKYGAYLSEKELLRISKKGYYPNENFSSFENSWNTVVGNNFTKRYDVPFKDYFNYLDSYSIQQYTGLPMGEIQSGEHTGQYRYIPPPPQSSWTSNAQRYINSLRRDFLIRSDLFQVTEAYWVSQKRMGWLRYVDSNGIPINTWVTDDISKEFLEEYDIKELSTKSLDEFSKSQEYNQHILWFYVPEVWHGIKINMNNNSLGNDKSLEDIYLKIEPLEYQLKRIDDIYNVVLPVSGIITPGWIDLVINYQKGYNYCMNRMANFIEKEIGKILFIDKKLLAADMKEDSEAVNTLARVFDIASESNMILEDTSRGTLNGDSPMVTRVGVQDLSHTPQIVTNRDIALLYKNLAFETLGFSPERLGQIKEYTSNEGLKQGQRGSFAQTERYFKDFDSFLQETYNLHLNVAQIAQSNSKDTSVVLTKSDGSKVYLESIRNKELTFMQFGVVVDNDQKARRDKQILRETVMQNTRDNSILTLASIITADSFREIFKIAKNAELQAQEQDQLNHQRTLEQIQTEAKLAEEKAIKDHERNMEIEHYRGSIDIYQEEIKAEGRALDKNVSINQLAPIQESRRLALQQQKLEQDNLHKTIEGQRKANEDDFRRRVEQQKIDIQNRQLDIREREMQSNEYIAVINE